MASYFGSYCVLIYILQMLRRGGKTENSRGKANWCVYLKWWGGIWEEIEKGSGLRILHWWKNLFACWTSSWIKVTISITVKVSFEEVIKGSYFGVSPAWKWRVYLVGQKQMTMFQEHNHRQCQCAVNCHTSDSKTLAERQGERVKEMVKLEIQGSPEGGRSQKEIRNMSLKGQRGGCGHLWESKKVQSGMWPSGSQRCGRLGNVKVGRYDP